MDLNRKNLTLGVASLVLVLAAIWLISIKLHGKQPVDDRASASMSAQIEFNTARMQDEIAASLDGRSTSAEQERLDSPRGQALFRNCSDWSELYDQHPSDDNEGRRDTACTALRRYVRDGDELEADASN